MNPDAPKPLRKRLFDYPLLVIKRKLLYRLLHPRPPRHPAPLTKPVFIVGSAPVSNPPVGFRRDAFTIFTVNGSQTVTARWGMGTPDATFLYVNQLDGAKPNALAVRAVLTGQETDLLWIVRAHRTIEELRRNIAAFNYRCRDLRKITRHQRMALYEAVTGVANFEMHLEEKFSTGITAVLYALHNCAPAVIITGIDPGSHGHVYNELNIDRMHISSDRATLLALSALGFPLYTSDPHVADSLGLPLWKGQIGRCEVQ
ncbi:membrane-anchored protein [Mesorhizobium sp. B1-1-8]|uniref:membrane-anchored protein n=1 Tax=Mesorhizobium sp. B1-1-8 TaxID=2589976 RepID=UPI00112D962A|nr:membrane-anchored protein [Mesorhizobium sp. B1-1-8]UCI10737.1 membrane-anchored protein [Mesorhizobium sp. B1-1-8]